MRGHLDLRQAGRTDDRDADPFRPRAEERELVARADPGGSLTTRRGAVVALAASLAAVLLLGLDAGSGFDLLSLPSRVLLLAVSAAGILASALLPGRRLPRRWRAALLLTSSAGLALGGSALWRDAGLARIARSAPRLSEEEIGRRADGIQAEFRMLLEEMAAPLRAARPSLDAYQGGVEPGFELLDQVQAQVPFRGPGHGMALY